MATGLVGLVVLLTFTSFFSSANCFSDVGGECALGGLSYGGRLYPSQDGLGHPWSRQKIFVFQTPRHGWERLGTGGGRGRVWLTSSQTCQGSQPPPAACPSREDMPCMDTSLPCIDFGRIVNIPRYGNPSPLEFTVSAGLVTVIRPEWNETTDPGEGPVTRWMIQYRLSDLVDATTQNVTELGSSDLSHDLNLRPRKSYDVRIALGNAGRYGTFSEWQRTKTPCVDLQWTSRDVTTSSKRVGYAKILVRWEYQSRCGVKNQTVRLTQLNRDNCSPEEGGGDLYDILHVPGIDARRKSVKLLNPHSLFNVTVSVVTMDDRTHSFSQEIWTNITAPSGVPIIGETRRSPARNWIILQWSRLNCGERNSDGIEYEYYLNCPTCDGGETWTRRTDRNRMVVDEKWAEKSYTFKVRAVSDGGNGDYSPVKSGEF